MGVSLLRNPPADGAGGILGFRYKTCEVVTGFQHLHVDAFDVATGAYTGGVGTETDVMATATAWLTLVQALFDAAWEIRWTQLYHADNVAPIGSPPVLQMVRHPVLQDVVGNGSGGTATTGAQIFTRTNLEFHTQLNGVEPIKFEGIGGVDIGLEDFVSATTGGTPALQAIVAYLEGTATRVVGHDGSPVVPNVAVHMTTDVVRKRRRAAIRI